MSVASGHSQAQQSRRPRPPARGRRQPRRQVRPDAGPRPRRSGRSGLVVGRVRRPGVRRPGVWLPSGGLSVRRRRVGGWGERERAEQEAEEHVRPEPVDLAIRARGLHRLGQRRDPCHRRGGLDAWQRVAGQRRGSLVLGVEGDGGIAFCLAASSLGAVGIGLDHGPAQRRMQLSEGQPPGPAEHGGFDLPRRIIAERTGHAHDHPGPAQIDLPGGERRTGRWQPPGEHHAEVCPAGRPVVRHRQRERNLPGRVRRHPIRTPGGVHLSPPVGPGRPRRDLGDRREFTRGGPRGQPPERGRDSGQGAVFQVGRASLRQPAGETWTGWQGLSDAPGREFERDVAHSSGCQRLLVGGFLRLRIGL